MADFEEKFRGSLSEVPPLPADLFGRVESTIRRKTIVARSMWSIAASLLLAVCAVGYYAVWMPKSSVADAVDEELQLISTYANGGDLDEDMVQYASLDQGMY
jgi:hypothetical protein